MFDHSIRHEHPSPFYGESNQISKITEKQFSAQIDEIIYRTKQSEGIKILDLYFFLSELVAKIGDVHTQLFPPGYIVNAMTYLPYQVQYFEGKWIITEIETQHSRYLGCELVAVSNIQFSQVFELTKMLFPWETENGAYQNAIYLNNASAFDYLGITQGEPLISVTLRNKTTGVLESITLKRFYEEAFPPMRSLAISYPETGESTEFYRYLILQEGKVLFIQYNVCENSPMYSMEQFALDIETQLIYFKPQKVIIDLRYNSGGNEVTIYPLITVLKRQQQSQQFLIDVLIGGKTIGAGVDAITELRTHLSTRLVGSQAGSNMIYFSNTVFFNLSHNLTIKIPTSVTSPYLNKYRAKNEVNWLSWQPDLVCTKSIIHYATGMDSELSAIIYVK